MISDPDWWQTFDYKLTMVVVVVSTLATVVVGVWRLSKRYTQIIHVLESKVSHTEMAECKSDIVKTIEESGQSCNKEIADERKENRDDHKAILVSLAEMNRLFIQHIDKTG